MVAVEDSRWIGRGLGEVELVGDPLNRGYKNIEDGIRDQQCEALQSCTFSAS